MSDENDLIVQFCAITGESSAHIAENYLIAHDFSLERAIDFYIDHPPQEAGNQALASTHEPPLAAAARPAAHPSVVEVPDDDDIEEAGLDELASQRMHALAARQQAEQQMEDMMGAAEHHIRRAGNETDMLAVQGHGLEAAPAGPRSRPRHDIPFPAGLADTDEDVDAIAAAMMRAGAGAELAGEQYGSYHRQQQQQMLDHYRQLAQQQQHTAGFQHAAAAGAMQHDLDAVAAAAAADDADDADDVADVSTGDIALNLPAGINLEEARMLEAAMLGVPYQGRIPDFNAAGAGPALSPGAMEQRNLRAEQDLAYEESLALDRAKQESIAAAKAEAEAQDRAEQEAAAAAARAQVQATQARAALLDRKRQRLEAAPEPAAGDPGSFTIMVRLPDGSRKGRRCRPPDALQVVFDFVDVQCSSSDSAAGNGSQEGCGGLKPGGYRLVTQFPRNVFVDGSKDSLQDVGITTDTALFVELL